MTARVVMHRRASFVMTARVVMARGGWFIMMVEEVLHMWRWIWFVSVMGLVCKWTDHVRCWRITRE